jgi:hypothetical protein
MDHSDPLRTLFADDIVFHQPGRNPTPATTRDSTRCSACSGPSANAPGTFRSEVHDLLATDQHAVAQVTAQ